MAYNVPPTLNTGDPWTAADHNTYVRDNFAAGYPDLFTGPGDLAVAAGNNSGDILAMPPGINYKILQARAGASKGIEWAPQGPSVQAYRSTAQAIADNTPTDISFDTKVSFDAGWFTPTAATMTVPANCGGLYLIMCHGYWSGHATTNKIRQLGVNISAVGALYHTTAQDSEAQSIWQTFSVVMQLAAAQTLTMRVLQISGGNLNFNLGRFTIWRIP